MEKRRLIPAIITLIGCLAACIIVIKNKYDALHSMTVILVVLVVFYVAGLIVKGVADKYLVIEEEKDSKETEQQEDAGNTEGTAADDTKAQEGNTDVSEKQ